MSKVLIDIGAGVLTAVWYLSFVAMLTGHVQWLFWVLTSLYLAAGIRRVWLIIIDAREQWRRIPRG